MTLSNLTLKATLLVGLLMIGFVDEEAGAGPTRIEPADGTPGPAAIELQIETEEGKFSRLVYFPWDSVDLTLEAQAAVREIADEMSDLESPSISITPQSGDELLAYERINAVAQGLESQGFSSSQLFTWSEIDGPVPERL